ncbi:TolC family protein [Pseudomonas sp.]|uniref:TolC family protein n=1 Tax=Pseudomonas sp. TaxID=306 RepID=UPI0028ACCFB9|nr:TolC family protein [Pseudomonas sp.]
MPDARQAWPDRQWWQAFASPTLDRLVERARRNSHDLAAATARVRQAQANAVIAGAPLLPEVRLALDANRQHLLRGAGYDGLDVSEDYRTSSSFDAVLSTRYEVDFWGGVRGKRDSALRALQASRFDRQTVELTLVGAVADAYLRDLALGTHRPPQPGQRHRRAARGAKPSAGRRGQPIGAGPTIGPAGGATAPGAVARTATPGQPREPVPPARRAGAGTAH